MLTGINYLLVTCLVTVTTAIRVDWNTNTGPIVPPTPRTTVRPIPPFREPAPVWEDLSNDIPNPNPYIYVLPPPSRPKQSLNTNVNYNPNIINPNKYGTIITPQNVNSYYQQNNNSPQVPSLSAQYIPNVGTRYVAVVPKAASAATKYPAASANALSLAGNDNGYKLQGKYNAKTKKYKAYEKVKYVPLNYYTLLKESESEEASSKRNVPDQIPVWIPADEQELPNEEYTIKFDNFLKWHATTDATDKSVVSTSTASVTHDNSTKSTFSKSTSLPSSFKLYSKYVYAKDLTPKSKEKFNKKS